MDFSWSLSHRQLVSAVIALVLPQRDSTGPILADLGYALRSLELPMVDDRGRQYRLDLHLTKNALNLSMLVECKTSAATLRADQIECYIATSGAQVVINAPLTLADPRRHRADALFVVLPTVETGLAALIAGAPTVSVAGWGIVRVSRSRIESVHDELSDSELSASLSAGWTIDVEHLPLERLPYEPDAPRGEFADVVLRTITAMFVSRRSEFSLDDACISSNELWPYLEAQHEHIRNRMRNEIRMLRRTALRGWIERVDIGTGREERWRFSRRPTTNRNVVLALARRHQRYISILLNEGRDPRAEDFVRIDPEQLTLEFPSAEN